MREVLGLPQNTTGQEAPDSSDAPDLATDEKLDEKKRTQRR
jgi:hypothetical protein